MDEIRLDSDEAYVAISNGVFLPGEFSGDWKGYIDWLNHPEQVRHRKRVFGGDKTFTKNQHNMGEFLLQHKDQLMKLGVFEELFNSIRSYLKHNK